MIVCPTCRHGNVEESGQEFVLRQVVTVKDENAWIISLSDSAEALPQHEADFGTILASWRFR